MKTLGNEGAGDAGNDGGGELVDAFGMVWIKGNHAGKFIAAQPGHQTTLRHQRGDATGAFLKDAVADFMAVKIVDLLEIIDIDHHEGCDFAMRAGIADENVGGRVDAAAVEAACQRVGFGQQASLRLGAAAFADLGA